MTPIGFLILVTLSLILCAWLQLSALWRMKWKCGRVMFVQRGQRLSASPYRESLNDCGMRLMAKGEATLQCIRRNGMDDLYVAGHGGVSAAFYDLSELSEWLMDRGIPFEDPVWEQLDQLIGEQS